MRRFSFAKTLFTANCEIKDDYNHLSVTFRYVPTDHWMENLTLATFKWQQTVGQDKWYGLTIDIERIGLQYCLPSVVYGIQHRFMTWALKEEVFSISMDAVMDKVRSQGMKEAVFDNVRDQWTALDQILQDPYRRWCDHQIGETATASVVATSEDEARKLLITQMADYPRRLAAWAANDYPLHLIAKPQAIPHSFFEQGAAKAS